MVPAGASIPEGKVAPHHHPWPDKPGPQGGSPHVGWGRRNWISRDPQLGKGSEGPCGRGQGTTRAPGPGEGLAAHPFPLVGRSLGRALPLGTLIQPAPARPASHHQWGGPYKIRAHGASLASRPGDKCGLFGV